jgi:hypothetical protein
MFEEPTTVGLSAKGHAILVRLREDDFFAEMQDAYRFAIALGIAHESTLDAKGSRQTIFNVGTLDPDQSIKNALKALHPDPGCAYYSLAERYAEWGVAEMGAQMDSGKLSLASFLTEAEELLDKKTL